ncbi:MAG: hypothetical protein AAFS07_13805 [Pseudomonadota bacterium]
MRLLAMLAVLAATGCQTASSVPTGSITGRDLQVRHASALICIDLRYRYNTDTAMSIDDRVKEAVENCDAELQAYADLLAEKAKRDNGWVRYTQPVPFQIKTRLQGDLSRLMTNYYEERA